MNVVNKKKIIHGRERGKKSCENVTSRRELQRKKIKKKKEEEKGKEEEKEDEEEDEEEGENDFFGHARCFLLVSAKIYRVDRVVRPLPCL